MEKTRGIKTNCGDQLARPYVNNQTLTKMYYLCTDLKYGSLFPELYLFDSENYNAYLYKSPKNRLGGRR